MGLSVLFNQHTAEDVTLQPEQLVELQERLRQRGVDIYRLQLAMVDRDFNESDYEALLELDSQNVQTRGASETEIARLPVFKIPVVTEEQQQGESVASVPNSTIVELPNSPDTPYCSQKLASSLIGQVTCPICLENYASNECVSTLPCLHRFHRDCINQAMRIKSNCPVCQTAVF
jgi:6,7-dimethyl-8-ribityllumazine synthase